MAKEIEVTKIVLVSPEISSIINGAKCIKQGQLIAGLIKGRHFYKDESSVRVIHFGRDRGGIILPNGTKVYCPTISRGLLNLSYSGGWRRIGRSKVSEYYTDADEGGSPYRSLASIIEGILEDYQKGKEDTLPKRLTSKFGSIFNKNQVRYSCFDGTAVHNKVIMGNKATLEEIHDEEKSFFVEYLKVTAHLLRTNPSEVGMHCPSRDGFILK